MSVSVLNGARLNQNSTVSGDSGLHLLHLTRIVESEGGGCETMRASHMNHSTVHLASVHRL